MWLRLACEDLRVFGIAEQITQKVDSMAPTLVSLIEQVHARLTLSQ